VSAPDDDTVRRLADGGLHRVIFPLNPEPRDPALERLDSLAALMQRCEAS